MVLVFHLLFTGTVIFLMPPHEMGLLVASTL